jgi:hypothetical protein
MPMTMVKVAGNGCSEVSIMRARIENAVANKAENEMHRVQSGICRAREANNFTARHIVCSTM